jgi:hypothetical protein
MRKQHQWQRYEKIQRSQWHAAEKSRPLLMRRDLNVTTSDGSSQELLITEWQFAGKVGDSA